MDAKPCANCGAANVQQYCPVCGQKNVDLHPPLRELVSETIEDAVGLDSRVRHTVFPFLFRPGFLTREFIVGRRARYTSPFKLFIVMSTLYFVFSTSTLRSTMATTAPAAFGAHGQAVASPTAAGPAAVSPPRGRLNARLHAHAEPFSSSDPKVRAAAGQAFAGEVLSAMPKSLFLLVPVFALLVSLVERRKGHVYVTHLVFSLHVHAFVFAVGWLSNVLPQRWDKPVSSVGAVIVAGYVLRALCVVYGDRVTWASLKLLAVAAGYSVAVALVLVVMMLGELAFF